MKIKFYEFTSTTEAVKSEKKLFTKGKPYSIQFLNNKVQICHR